MSSEPSGEGCILEIASSDIVIKGWSVASEIGLDDVEIAVHVVVGSRDAHARLRFAVGAQSASRFDGDVFEFAVPFVLIEGAGRGVVRDVNIRPAVVVEVSGQDT